MTCTVVIVQHYMKHNKRSNKETKEHFIQRSDKDSKFFEYGKVLTKRDKEQLERKKGKKKDQILGKKKRNPDGKYKEL